MLIDTHCHVDRYPNPLEIAHQCENERITTVAVTQLPSHYELALPHVSSLRHVKLALGFHPLAVKGNLHELELFARLLPTADYIGEVGLDFSPEGRSSKDDQLRVFSEIIESLSKLTKFISIHSRDASDEVLSILENFGVRKAVFHWYSGGLKCLDRAVDFGCFFSINPSMIATDKGRAIIARVPRNRVLTETDGPYVKISRRAAHPRDVKNVIAHLSRVWISDELETETQIEENFRDASGK